MSRRFVTSLLVVGAIAALVTAFLLPPNVGHPVTPLMKSAAEGNSGKTIATLPLDATRPTVVVFVLPDCPCSIEYEPYVHRLFRAYGEEAAFVEVVAGSTADARQWKEQHRTPFEVTGDPEKKISREFGAIRSAYTALVVNKRIVKLWPGYSAEMLRELGELIAEHTKRPSRPLDPVGAPERLTSGCVL